MYYSVKELLDNLYEKVEGLGIDPKFKDNPAYDSVLGSIKSLFSQMNMFENVESVNVYEEQGNISLDWVSPNGNKYYVIISCSNPETINCVWSENQKPFLGTNGQTIRLKNVSEIVATISKDNFITLVTNNAMIDNIDCSIDKCHNSTSAERKYYSSDGIMIEREYKSFPKGELTESFDRAKVDSMLFVPRQAFDFGVWRDSYESRDLLVRNMLDTARYVYENKLKGIRFSTITPLKQEKGLRDMVLPGGYVFPPDVVITPLSKEEIEEMIQRERNPKVAEGLRKYAVGRENYYYSTVDDKNFVFDSDSKTQKM